MPAQLKGLVQSLSLEERARDVHRANPQETAHFWISLSACRQADDGLEGTACTMSQMSSVSLRMWSAPLPPQIVIAWEIAGHNRSSGESFCVGLFFLLHKRLISWICWNTDVLQTWFLHFTSTPKFCQNQPSCSKCFDFCQQNPFQQNMVLSKFAQEDFVLSLVSAAQLWKWDRKKELAANSHLPGNSQDVNPSTLKPPEWHYPFNDPVKIPISI